MSRSLHPQVAEPSPSRRAEAGCRNTPAPRCVRPLLKKTVWFVCALFLAPACLAEHFYPIAYPQMESGVGAAYLTTNVSVYPPELVYVVDQDLLYPHDENGNVNRTVINPLYKRQVEMVQSQALALLRADHNAFLMEAAPVAAAAVLLLAALGFWMRGEEESIRRKLLLSELVLLAAFYFFQKAPHWLPTTATVQTLYRSYGCFDYGAMGLLLALLGCLWWDNLVFRLAPARAGNVADNIIAHVKPPPLPSAPAPAPEPPPAPYMLEDVDALIAEHRFGTAAEVLALAIDQNPRDFELVMRLARLLAVECGNADGAEKLLRRTAARRQLSPRQLAAGRKRIKAWTR